MTEGEFPFKGTSYELLALKLNSVPWSLSHRFFFPEMMLISDIRSVFSWEILKDHDLDGDGAQKMCVFNVYYEALGLIPSTEG